MIKFRRKPTFLTAEKLHFYTTIYSWHIIATKKGAGSSAILYSIAETAKANNLKTFDYFQYLLEQLLLHLDDSPAEYIDDLMPWSKKRKW